MWRGGAFVQISMTLEGKTVKEGGRDHGQYIRNEEGWLVSPDAAG